MAIELNTADLEKFHEIACDPESDTTYIITALCFDICYYLPGDWTTASAVRASADIDIYRQTLALLILAAEEELDGYPMEAAE